MDDNDNQLITERRDKLAALRERAKAQGAAAFPNDFKPRHHAAELHRRYDAASNEELESQAIGVAVAGRMMLKRVMGKACFATLQDMAGRIQLYVTQRRGRRGDARGVQALGPGRHRRRRGHAVPDQDRRAVGQGDDDAPADQGLRPLPEKFHGLTDQEQKYRQRYVDLITDEVARARSSRAARWCMRSATSSSRAAISKSRRR